MVSAVVRGKWGTMEFENGLPLPDRSLDAYIAGHILGWTDGPHVLYKWSDRKQKKHPYLVFHNAPRGTWEGWDNSAYANEAGEKFYAGKPKEVYIPGHYSTTSTCFRVMETAEGFFEFFQHDKFIVDWHRDPSAPFDCIRIAIPYLDTLEQTFAWGLCAVVWKGKTNEG